MGGLHKIPITIADILLDLQSPFSAQELGIENRLGPFLGVPEKPVGRVSLRWEESSGALVPHGELIYNPGSIWRIYKAEEKYCAAIGYPSGDGSACVQAVLEANASWDELTLTEQRHGSTWQSLLNTGAGELIVRTSLLFADGLIFHACGVDDNGRGIVFVGHSGAGKSTQAGLWDHVPGAVVMNDDRVAVRCNSEGAMCHGTPWGGTADIARNHSSPLSAIIILEQAANNSIEPLASSVSVPMLLARAFLPYWDQGLMERAISNLNAILDCVPVYRLECRPERQIIGLVRSIL